jgi:hypothetical protein
MSRFGRVTGNFLSCWALYWWQMETSVVRECILLAVGWSSRLRNEEDLNDSAKCIGVPLRVLTVHVILWMNDIWARPGLYMGV